MPAISGILPSRRSPQRAVIQVDGRAVATLSSKLIGELALAPGQSWDDDIAAQVDAAVRYDKALHRAANQLARRPMAAAALRRKLEAAGHDQATIGRVMDRLTETGLIDDEAFGRALIAEQRARRPAGPRLLRDRLARQGLDAALIDRLIDELGCAGPAAVDEAVELATSKLRSLADLAPAARKRRLWGLLARRGYDEETIEAALSRLGGMDDTD